MRGKIGVLFLIIFLLAIFIAPSVWFINEHMQELKEATKDQVETEEVIELAMQNQDLIKRSLFDSNYIKYGEGQHVRHHDGSPRRRTGQDGKDDA